VKTGQAFEQREIQLGKRNSTHAIVISGVSRGDQVARGEIPAAKPATPAK